MGRGEGTAAAFAGRCANHRRARRGQGRSGSGMRFVERHPLADPEAAARKLIERLNEPLPAAGGSGEQFRFAIERAIALGWLWRYESGTDVKFTDSGAALFA